MRGFFLSYVLFYFVKIFLVRLIFVYFFNQENCEIATLKK